MTRRNNSAPATTAAAIPEFKSHGRLLKLKDVVEQTSLGVATIYRRMNAGTFPRNRSLGGGRVAWTEADIETWKHRAINGELDAPD